jgi:hypothetical protein
MQCFWICTAVMLSLLFAAYSIVPALAGPGHFRCAWVHHHRHCWWVVRLS